MKPEEALNLLDEICSKVNLTRESHVKVQQAVTLLRNSLLSLKNHEAGSRAPEAARVMADPDNDYLVSDLNSYYIRDDNFYVLTDTVPLPDDWTVGRSYDIKREPIKKRLSGRNRARSLSGRQRAKKLTGSRR